jgi:transcriptional regulator with XRE-family HTH domain
MSAPLKNATMPSSPLISAHLAKMVRDARLAAQMSIHEVAGYLGVSEDVLARFETGKQPIPLHHVFALANCLNISPRLVLDLGLGTDKVSV